MVSLSMGFYSFQLVLIIGCVLNNVSITLGQSDPGANSPNRLPLTQVDPMRLTMTLKLDLSDMSIEKLPYEGSLTYYLYITEPLRTITFTYHEIDVDWWGHTLFELTDGENNQPITYYPSLVLSRPQNQMTDIVYDKYIQPARYRASFTFNSTVRTDQVGLYRSNYTENGIVKHLITTQFAAAYARSVFPGFDEPRFRMQVALTVIHNNPNYHVVSNMPITNITYEDDGYITNKFEATPDMPLYLLALLISEYDNVTSSDSRVNTYAPASVIDQAYSSVDFGNKALGYLESYFAARSQLPKIDFAAIPHFKFGAMENWGLITYRSSVLLYDPKYPTKTLINNIESQALTITHELIHMWFGNEVTPYYWHYVWLSEGFAKYFEFTVTDKLEPTWKIMEQFGVRNVQSALAQDDRLGVRPMSGYIDEPDKVANVFDYVVYAKASSIIRMLQTVIGESAFRNSIIYYLTYQSFNYTVPEALYANLQSEIDIITNLQLPANISKIFDSWAEFEGYPLVTVLRNYNTDDVSFLQTRFLINKEERLNNSESSKYFIPISYSDLESDEKLIWLTDEIPSVTVKYTTKNNSFILANLYQRGFYRVNYDHQNWELIIAQLHSDYHVIPVEIRAQLIDDAGNLAATGLLEYDKAFRILSYLANEDEYVPWLAASRTLAQLERALRGYSNHDLMEKFLANITTHVYKNKLSVLDYNNTDHVTRMHRLATLEWACKFGLKECLDDVNIALDYIINNIEEEVGKPFIPYEIRTQIYCAAAKYSDPDNKFTEKLYEYLKQIAVGRLVTDKQLDEARRVIGGLGCSLDEEFLTEFLGMTLNKWEPGYEYLREEGMTIFNAVAQSSYIGTKSAMDFIQNYHSGMKFEYDNVHLIFNTISNYINSDYLLTKLRMIMSMYVTLLDEESLNAAEKALAIGEQSVKWLDQYSDSINDWLINNSGNQEDEDDGSATIAVSLSLLITSVIVFIFN